MRIDGPKKVTLQEMVTPEGSKVTIVWACPLDVDTYIERGQKIESPQAGVPALLRSDRELVGP